MQQVTAMDPAAQAQRREKLNRLDAVLDQLEDLHIHNEKWVPELAVTRMRQAGIVLSEKGPVTVTAAIEAVWKAQEPFMLKGFDEKTKRKRRSKAEIAAQAANTVSV
jgi:hypothetical protein